MSRCPYKDIFGAPKSGSHGLWRLPGDIAATDTIMTVIAAWLLQRWFFPERPFWVVLAVFFIIGEFMHWLFGVDTAVIKMLGLSNEDFCKSSPDRVQ